MNLIELAAGIQAAHQHVSVADANDHRMILAVNEEPYPWHEHPNSDELETRFVEGGAVGP